MQPRVAQMLLFRTNTDLGYLQMKIQKSIWQCSHKIGCPGATSINESINQI